MQNSETEVVKTETVAKNVYAEATDKIVRHHVYASMGVSLLPFPLLDFAALTGIQLNMLRKIAKLYGVPFFKGKVRNTLLSLFGGAFPTIHAAPLAASMTKLVPAVGQTAGVTAMPILAGATTYAIGRLVVHHLAWGGTLETLDPEKVKSDYAEMFEEGKAVAANMT
ncbi:DUF697 domain-containing protein [Desulfobacterales bacterium HSG2]|nr:DUF697 domain-containing protein [Desulfobacterales bacterium HSG2]